MRQFEKDMNIISMLPNLPNDEDGMTAEELKAKFDEGGLALQEWINNTLLPSINSADIPFTPTHSISGENIQAAVEDVQRQIVEAAAGQIVDGSIGKEKLTSELMNRVYGGRPYMSIGEPTEEDNPSADFPVGQIWYRPEYTVYNEAKPEWAASGCNVADNENGWRVTGTGMNSTVTISQNLNMIGAEGDNVYVNVAIGERDSRIVRLQIQFGTDEPQTLANGVYASTVQPGGNLNVTISATWEAAALATGSFDIDLFTIVNGGKCLREAPGSADRTNWKTFVSAIGDFGSHFVESKAWVQSKPGTWEPMYVGVTPTTMGGTGHSSYTDGDMLYAENGELSRLSAPTGASLLASVDGMPQWKSGHEVKELFGLKGLELGTYTGNGDRRTVELPAGTIAVLIAVKSSTSAYGMAGNLTSSLFVEGSLINGQRSKKDDDYTYNWREQVEMRNGKLEFTVPTGTVPSGEKAVTVMNANGTVYTYLAVIGG